MDQVPASFKRVLASRGLRGQTVYLYAYYANALLTYFQVPVTRLRASDVLEWIGYAQSELAWQPRTINVALAAFRLLFEAVGRPGVMAGVRNLRFDHPEPEVLSVAEVTAILAQAPSVTLQAAVTLLYGAGLRISELLALRFSDLDSGRGVLLIGASKNRHARHALLPSRALPLLRDLWRLRRAQGVVALGDRVFVSKAGKELRRDLIATALSRSAERAGVSKRVYPHLLRHSFATHLIERGVDVTTVQKLLGHRSLSSTARYIHLTAATRAGLQSPADLLPVGPRAT